MPGINLTREEAFSRSRHITVDSYEISLDLTTGPTHFRSQTTLKFTADAGEKTFVDLVDATELQIALNGVPIDPDEAYRDSRIELDALAASNTLTVDARLPYSRTGEGLHRFVDPADGRVYLYSQFEVPDARRVYAAFEQPDLKASFTFHVTAPDTWVVVSNSPTPEPIPGAHGSATWHFSPTDRISTYITAVIAGEYHSTFDTYDGIGGEISLGHYCRQSLVEHLDLDELLEITKQGFEFFESTFAVPYPFGKYDQLYVPEYNMGAMENAGAVTFRDEYLPRSRQVHSFYENRANTILHEMAHMWFGNLVTMRWWNDLWLNESFAEWASHYAMEKATKYAGVWTGFTNSRKNWAYRQDQLPSTHPVAADNYDLEAVEVNFDGITYAKGASILKQLVAWVGEQPFIAGLRDYFAEHAWGNTEFTDLTRALEAASGRELDTWANEWLRTSGVNTLAPEFDIEAGAYTGFRVRQSAPAKYPTLRRHRIGIGLYDLNAGVLTLRERFEVDVAGASTEITELIGIKQPDLLLLNDGDLAYAKIRLDPLSLQQAMSYIDAIEDSLARALVWGAAWDMTRDAHMPPADFVDLVLGGLGAESDSTAVSRLPSYAHTAVEYYSPASARRELREHWEDGVYGLLLSAKPGSDHQLSFARALSQTAHSPRVLTFLSGLLTGSEQSLEQVPGLTLDADLRWTFIAALARNGVYSSEQIDAELAIDSTISGQEHAARARASMPTPEAKRQAWHDAIDRDDIANETQRQIALGFALPGQEEILQPFLQEYLTCAETIWEAKGVQRASTALELMFPMPLTSVETLDQITTWLATSTANPGAKRYVAEGADDMARALRAQGVIGEQELLGD